MTIYYELNRETQIQIFVAADRMGKEIKATVSAGKIDFPHLILSNHLDNSLWTVTAFNFETYFSDIPEVTAGNKNFHYFGAECELLCDRQDWATAHEIFLKLLKQLEWDFYQIHEPKFLEIIDQMQEVLNENPHLAQSYPSDFFHDVDRISAWGAEIPVFVWLVKEMGTHLLWQTPKLKGRHSAQEQIKDFARNYSPEGKLFVGHIHFNTLQEVSSSEAEKFFPVNPKELKAYLEYVPTLE